MSTSFYWVRIFECLFNGAGDSSTGLDWTKPVERLNVAVKANMSISCIHIWDGGSSFSGPLCPPSVNKPPWSQWVMDAPRFSLPCFLKIRFFLFFGGLLETRCWNLKTHGNGLGYRGSPLGSSRRCANQMTCRFPRIPFDFDPLQTHTKKEKTRPPFPPFHRSTIDLKKKGQDVVGVMEDMVEHHLNYSAHRSTFFSYSVVYSMERIETSNGSFNSIADAPKTSFQILPVG